MSAAQAGVAGTGAEGPGLEAGAAGMQGQAIQETFDHLGQASPDSSPGGTNPQASSPAADDSPEAEPVAAAAVEAADEAAEAAEAESVGQAAESGAGDGGKRDYVRWAPEEEEVFYEALHSVTGQKPEVCLREITKRLAGSKDYAQVRHYYYRLIKRLNKILGDGPGLDTKNPLQVHRSMLKFWEVFVDKGMKGTCMVGIMKKPRKQWELSTTLQRGVKAVVQRTSGTAGKAAAGAAATGTGVSARSRSSSRKRKPRGAEGGDAAAATAAAGQQGCVEMADAALPPPPKQRRRTSWPSTCQKHLLMAAESGGAAAAGIGTAGMAATAEGSSQSHTDGHEGGSVSEKPASGSQTAGSQPQAPRVSTTHSFRSSSNAGLSGLVLDGSMGQVGGKLRLQLQLMPLDVGTAHAMAGAGLHPFLELTLSTSKSLLSVLRHLGAKWQQATPIGASAVAGSGSMLFVHPPANCPISLRGVCWGGPDCDGQLKVGDIYTTLHCPAPFQLLYSWSHPAGATAAAAAAVPPSRRQASARPALQQQQSAEATLLTAELREAISAVAAATQDAVAGAAGIAAAAAAAAPMAEDRHLQGQQASMPEPFPQLLQGGNASNHATTATAYASVGDGFAPPAAPTFLHPAGAIPMAVELQLEQQVVAPNPAPARGSGTPDQAVQAGSGPGRAIGEPAPTPGTADPRKPRGLLGLLQTPAGKACKVNKRVPSTKQQVQLQHKPPCSTCTSARQVGRGGRQQQQQQQAAPQHQGAAEAGHVVHPCGMPLPTDSGQLMWAHMHPHLQQPQPPQQRLQPSAVPILQQQQRHPMLQPVLHMPMTQVQQPAQQPQQVQPVQQAQQQQAASRECLGIELDFGDSLLRILGGDHTGASTELPNLAVFGSPGSGGRQPTSAAPLSGSGDFSLKSWPSLSPPSNFQLPDGFDTSLSPLCKSGAAGVAAPTAAGTLKGGAKAEQAGAGVISGVNSILGPTDFSLLLAGISAIAAPGARQQTAEGAADRVSRQPAQATAQAPQQQGQAPGPAAVVHQTVDALFGSVSLFGMLGSTQQLEDGMLPAAAALPPLPNKELADLTFDFGSLLGVGDAAPSWLGPPAVPGGRPAPQTEQQEEHQVPPVGDRPFASLFDN